MERAARSMTAALVLAAAALFAAAGAARPDIEPSRALVRSLGLYAPALCPEADAARSLLEGISGSMAEYPGAYCPDRFCELAGPGPLADRPLFRVGFVRRGR